MSEELKKRTKTFALDVIELSAGLPQGLETRSLATLRDTLLPKLLSGELQINQ